jgi:hypothetical protein
MKRNPTSDLASKFMLALTIVLSIVFIHSCKREKPDPTQQPDDKIKPQVVDCGPGYHWDFTLRQCVPNCPSGYVYCPALGTCVPNGSCTTSGSDIDRFKASSDFISFKNSNPGIAAKIDYEGATVRMDYNNLLGENLKTINFSVIESTGDTSAMVIGVPLTTDNITNYLIFYATTQLLVRDSRGYYYGTAQADLYNTTASYTAQFNSSFELVTDAVVAGPRWISNYSCTTCKWFVWPSAKCIGDAISYFFSTCNCKVLCAVSNYASTLSCTLGTFMGAAAFCARHNNMPHT